MPQSTITLQNTLEAKYQAILKFINDNPDLRPRTLKSLEQYKSAYNSIRKPKEPETVSDAAISLILKEFYSYPNESLDSAILNHRHAMAAENIIWHLLEKYLAQKLEALWWIWCCWEIVKSVDFIKFNNQTQEWEALQVKNRDNTENSSSSSVRDWTIIKKWFRSFSRRQETNWNNFPDSQARQYISEDDFRNFIKGYL